MEISKTELIEMFKRMLLSRRFEEKVVELYRAGLKGQYHLSIGQEAVAVGVCATLKPEDSLLSTHRGKGHYIAKGGDLKALMAEFMEKRTGCNRGKGGPMHIIDPEAGILGANGIVGSSLPIACGVALAAKLQGIRKAVVGFFGDGAVNSGPCHESMNIAGIWKLPVVFVCENNFYQQAVPFDRGSSIPHIYTRAAGYGFPGVLVDGMDVLAVYEAAKQAVERARKNEGPSLLECKTYRFRGHSEADPTRGTSYRSPEEIASWEKKCPVLHTRNLLLDKGWVSERDLDAMERECGEAVQEALAFAEKSEEVPPEWAMEDIYAP